jgi:hypothetical protein
MTVRTGMSIRVKDLPAQFLLVNEGEVADKALDLTPMASMAVHQIGLPAEQHYRAIIHNGGNPSMPRFFAGAENPLLVEEAYVGVPPGWRVLGSPFNRAKPWVTKNPFDGTEAPVIHDGCEVWSVMLPTDPHPVHPRIADSNRFHALEGGHDYWVEIVGPDFEEKVLPDPTPAQLKGLREFFGHTGENHPFTSSTLLTGLYTADPKGIRDGRTASATSPQDFGSWVYNFMQWYSRPDAFNKDWHRWGSGHWGDGMNNFHYDGPLWCLEHWLLHRESADPALRESAKNAFLMGLYCIYHKVSQGLLKMDKAFRHYVSYMWDYEKGSDRVGDAQDPRFSHQWLAAARFYAELTQDRDLVFWMNKVAEDLVSRPPADVWAGAYDVRAVGWYYRNLRACYITSSDRRFLVKAQAMKDYVFTILRPNDVILPATYQNGVYNGSLQDNIHHLELLAWIRLGVQMAPDQMTRLIEMCLWLVKNTFQWENVPDLKGGQAGRAPRYAYNFGIKSDGTATFNLPTGYNAFLSSVADTAMMIPLITLAAIYEPTPAMREIRDAAMDLVFNHLGQDFPGILAGQPWKAPDVSFLNRTFSSAAEKTWNQISYAARPAILAQYGR